MLVVGIPQSWRISGAIKTLERKLRRHSLASRSGVDGVARRQLISVCGGKTFQSPAVTGPGHRHEDPRSVTEAELNFSLESLREAGCHDGKLFTTIAVSVAPRAAIELLPGKGDRCLCSVPAKRIEASGSAAG